MIATILAQSLSIDGFGFDPFLRGLLVVGVGVVVLMGSVYLLLATNSGARTGAYIALAGFFSWMTVMGFIWWIYGIGLAGSSPSWEVIEINRGDVSAAATEPVRDLTTWPDLPPSDPARGEAQASVDEFLLGSDEFASTLEYLPVAGFEKGGKPVRTDDSMFGRVKHKISSTLQLTHPIHYAVIQVQAVTPESLIVEPGAAPPIKEPDSSQPVVSVIMVRDLGNLRLPPALVTIGSAILLVLFSWLLHTREGREREARAAFAGA